MIAILFSNWWELEESKNCLKLYHGGNRDELEFMRGKLHGKEVILGRTGIGINRARKGTNFIIQRFKPELIISAGHGGALSPELRVGDIVIGEWVMSTKKNQRKLLFKNIPGALGGFRRGGIVTENRFVYASSDKRRLYEQSGALSVDMETWGIVESTEKSNVQIISLRSISDEYCDEVPNLGYIYDKRGILRKGRALNYFLSNPSHLYTYAKLVLFNFKKASHSLNSFLKELLIYI